NPESSKSKMTATKRALFDRKRAVTALLAAGVALLGLGAVPWLSGKAAIPGTGQEVITASGGQTAPVVPALGLILLAAAVALALARRIGVAITALLAAAAGVGTTVVSGVVLSDPAQAMRSEVTETTAILLPPEAITETEITLWGPVAAVVGVIILVLAL